MESLVKIPHSELGATLERLSSKNVTQEHFKRLRSNDKYLERVAEVILSEFPVRLDYGDVRAILGDDFFSPDEISHHRMFRDNYTYDQLRHLYNTLPSERIIQWLKSNKYMLIAGPPCKLSLVVAQTNHVIRFCSYDETGAALKAAFATKESVGCEWLMLCKTPVEGSLEKPWDEEMKLISKEDFIPNAVQVSWGFILHHKLRGEYLLRTQYVRTSSVDENGNHIGVGNHDGHGLCLYAFPNEKCHSHIGIASARESK